MIAVTAIYGAYDRPKPPPPGVSSAFMFTDGAPGDWTPVRIGPAETLPGRFRSKGPKACPHFYFEDQQVMWVDGSLQPTGRDVRDLLDSVPSGGVGCYRHRVRDCVVQESAASALIRRYKGEHVITQAQQYIRNGLPRRYGLWETGVVVWNGAQHTMGARWLAEMLAWSSQDQISFPYVAHKLGVTVTDLPGGSSVDNPWFKYVDHEVRDW